MNGYALAAAIVALATVLVHLIPGGRFVARPLLENRSLPRASKWLNYFCWHIVTVMIIFIGIGFYWSGQGPENRSALVFLSAFTAVVSMLSAAVALTARINPFKFPSTSLFAVTSILGWASLYA